MGESLAARWARNAAGDVLGAVVGEHRPHGDAEAAERRDDVVDESDRVCGVGDGPSTISMIAQRVAVSIAVSWYTLPTPLRLPM